VPSFLKTWDELGLERKKLTFTALFDTDERYKQGPKGEEKGKQIHRVPTFIFKRDGKEIARIVETPQNDLLTDIGQIALGLPSQPNYMAASYLMNLFEKTSVAEIRADLNTYFYKTHDYLGKSSELSTLGYVLLRSGRIEEAVLVFEFNFYFFRYNPYVIGSYANALEQQGELEKAREFYERALKIDPENKRVKKLYEDMKKEESKDIEPTVD
jgi:tetratricopeptide (TPR) repeat protein